MCLAGGFATAITTALACWFWLGVDPSDATFPIMLATLPFWLASFWKPRGMPFERFLPLLAKHHLAKRHFEYTPSHRDAMAAPLALEPRKLARKERKRTYRKGAELYEPAEEA